MDIRYPCGFIMYRSNSRVNQALDTCISLGPCIMSLFFLINNLIYLVYLNSYIIINY